MNKVYKVTAKVEYEITMFHTQENKKKAINDVKSVVDELLKSNSTDSIKVLFEGTKPQTKYSAVLKSDEDK